MMRSMRDLSFDDYVRKFRTDGKLPRIWKTSDIRPLLKGIFSDNTIGVYPNNFSCTPDGLNKGDAIKRGLKPKYYRLGKSTFILIEEYESDFIPQSALDFPSTAEITAKPEIHSSTSRSFRSEEIEKTLFAAFPSLNDLMIFAGKCDSTYRKSSKSLELYREIISAHNNFGINSLVQDSDFHNLIYRTLISWDMNNRRAKLVDFESFSSGIKAISTLIRNLAPYSMAELDPEEVNGIESKIKDLFRQFKVMQSKSQIVGCSKALHFLLPRLIMPIDGKFTLNFLFGYRKYYEDIENETHLFIAIFMAFHSLARRLRILDKEEIFGNSWNTTVPKIIDNAIIGYTIETNKSLSTRKE